ATGATVIRSWADVDRTTSENVDRLERYQDLEVTATGEPDIRILPEAKWDGGFIDRQIMINYLAHGYDRRRYNDTTSTGPMTDEQKAERKLLIRRNREWDSATVVRVRWLSSFLARKDLPKDTAAFIATSLARYGRELNEKGQSLSQELLGLTATSGRWQQSPLADLVDEQPGKAALVTLALILGQFEGNTSRETWRYPNALGRTYLQQLRIWGYALAPVERIAAGDKVDDLDTTFVETNDDED
ncbi:MAG: hypothetical protein ABI067_06725, partial [Leifsonia sp.]